MRLELGSRVYCTDGPFGELADVVVDPVGRRVTHLVVEPRHDHGLARLVPIELAGSFPGSGPALSLRCTVGEARRFDGVEEFAYLRLGEPPIEEEGWEIGVHKVLTLPHSDFPGLGPSASDYDLHVAMTYDRVPKGTVELSRACAVVSADAHHVGRVEGVVVDPEARITHVVVERGHLLGRREVTVPISVVTRVETDAVTLRLRKDEVGSLPSVPVLPWAS